MRKVQEIATAQDDYRFWGNATALDSRGRSSKINFKSAGALRVGSAFANTVSHNSGGVFDMSAQPSPTRGTLFKSPSSGMPTFWHESICPQFSTEQPVFSVKNGKTLNKNPSKVSYDTMTRLMKKPAHKKDRPKFDNKS